MSIAFCYLFILIFQPNPERLINSQLNSMLRFLLQIAIPSVLLLVLLVVHAVEYTYKLWIIADELQIPPSTFILFIKTYSGLA